MSSVSNSNSENTSQKINIINQKAVISYLKQMLKDVDFPIIAKENFDRESESFNSIKKVKDSYTYIKDLMSLIMILTGDNGIFQILPENEQNEQKKFVCSKKIRDDLLDRFRIGIIRMPTFWCTECKNFYSTCTHEKEIAYRTFPFMGGAQKLSLLKSEYSLNRTATKVATVDGKDIYHTVDGTIRFKVDTRIEQNIIECFKGILDGDQTWIPEWLFKTDDILNFRLPEVGGKQLYIVFNNTIEIVEAMKVYHMIDFHKLTKKGKLFIGIVFFSSDFLYLHEELEICARTLAQSARDIAIYSFIADIIGCDNGFDPWVYKPYVRNKFYAPRNEAKEFFSLQL